MIDPKRVFAQVALRTMQLSGTNQSDLSTAYTAALVSLDGAEQPALAIVDAVVASEARLSHLIASDKLSPYRAELYGRSENLNSDTEVPAVSDEDLPFIGVFSQVADSEDNMTLTEQPIHVIRRFLRGSYTTEIYNYAIQTSRIYHTREAVYFEGCVFDRDAALQRLSALSSELSPLPEVLESTWIADTIANMPIEGWLAGEGAYYGRLAAEGLTALMNRKTPLVLDAISTQDPVAN